MANLNENPSTSLQLGRRSLAALPLLLVAALYAAPLLKPGFYLFFTTHQSLGQAMSVEWIVMVSGFFLMIPLAIRPSSKPGKILKLAIVVLLAGGMFGSVVFSTLGLGSLVYFLTLVFLTYGGVSLFNDSANEEILIMMNGVRWVVTMMIFVPLQLILDLSQSVTSWQRDDQVLAFGAWFFGLLAVLEATFYFWLSDHLHTRTKQNPVQKPETNANYLARLKFYRNLYRKQ